MKHTKITLITVCRILIVYILLKDAVVFVMADGQQGLQWYCGHGQPHSNDIAGWQCQTHGRTAMILQAVLTPTSGTTMQLNSKTVGHRLTATWWYQISSRQQPRRRPFQNWQIQLSSSTCIRFPLTGQISAATLRWAIAQAKLWKFRGRYLTGRTPFSSQSTEWNNWRTQHNTYTTSGFDYAALRVSE